ncbi:uncharacterized protein V6R79_015309 [Siganus canaliculatus]
MKSVYALLCTSVLLSELSCRSVAGALPANAVEDGEAGPDGLGLILGDDPMAEPAGVPPLYMRSHVLDNEARSEDQGSKIIFVSDAESGAIWVQRCSGAGEENGPLRCCKNGGNTFLPFGVPAAWSSCWRRIQHLRCERGKSSLTLCVVSPQSLINTVFQDTRLKGIRGLNSPFSRSVPLLAERSLSRSPAEPSVKYERRNTDLDSE